MNHQFRCEMVRWYNKVDIIQVQNVGIKITTYRNIVIYLLYTFRFLKYLNLRGGFVEYKIN